MFCTSCGHEIAPGMKFCMHCGKPAPETPAEPVPPVTPPEAAGFEAEAAAFESAHTPDVSDQTNVFNPKQYGDKVYGTGKNKTAGEGAVPPEPEQPWTPPVQDGPPPPNWQNPPEPQDPKRRRKGAGSSPMRVILIAGIALAAVLLLVIGGFLYFAGTDSRNIETVKSGHLGPYTDTTVQEFLYHAYGADYDTATWAGRSMGLLKRAVSLVFSSSTDPDKEPFRALFVMGEDGTFCLTDMDVYGLEVENSQELVDAVMLPLLLWKPEYQQIASELPACAVLGGASADFSGNREEIYTQFEKFLGDDLPVEPYRTVNRTDPTDTGSIGTGTVLPETTDENAGSVDAPVEPTPEPGLQIPTGTWYDLNTNYRSLQIEAIAGVENAYRYTLVNEQTTVSRYCYKGEVSSYDAAHGILSYSQTAMTQVVRAGAAGERERPVRDGFATTITLSGDTLVWSDPEAGISVTFAQAAKTLAPQAITASFSTNAPSLSVGKCRVTSAIASSTIIQETVTNDPIVMFDGQDETSWQEGSEGYGIGEQISFTLEGVQEIHAMSFKLGNWRNDRYFNGNAAPKTMTLILGDYKTSVTFEHGRTTQWVTFSEPVYADSIQIVIDEVYPGKDYEDTCINEIAVYGEYYE